MNRTNSTVFIIPNGEATLSMEIRALLYSLGADPGKNVIQYQNEEWYNGEDVIWLPTAKLDEGCQNSAFWSAMVSGDIVSARGFNVKVEYPVLEEDYPSTAELDIWNSWILYHVTDSTQLALGAYVSNEAYQSDYVLTDDKVDAIPDIEAWITTRGIKTPGTFSFAKSDANLKLEVKTYYNLITEGV